MEIGLRIVVTVRDLMDKHVVTIKSSESVSEAVKKMLRKGVWSLVVTKRGKPVGVVTDRDILRRCLGEGLTPKKMNVEGIMTSPIITIKPNTAIGEAMRMMIEKGVRRLYIIEGQRIIGRITQAELFESTFNALMNLWRPGRL